VRAAAGRPPGAGLRGVTVGVLGLTFKAGTDDLRDSPSVAIVQALLAAGANVQAYDPTVESPPTGAKAAALRGVTLASEPLAAATDASVLVIATEWPEFADLDLEKVTGVMVANGDRPPAVVDTRNQLDPTVVRAAGLGYEGVGRVAS
jgi:UDPglucose 6-dehydrogenase